MPASENTEAVQSGTAGQRGSRSLMLEGAQGAPAVSWEQSVGPGWRPRQLAPPSMASGVVELATALSGLALVLFMFGHLGMLVSVLLGSGAMDGLAGFLEGYYLLHAATPFLILIIVAHVALTAGRAPTTFRQQRALLVGMGRLRHFDTYTWAFQVISGVALLAFAAIHLWTTLTDLPIEAAKSGVRVNGSYLWFNIPFILLVQGHLALGLYRLAVKWGVLERVRAYLLLSGLTAVVLGLDSAVLATFYRLGGA